ncbi:acyltransferase [Sphingomonas sp. CD22]|uniref:acyltransferase family protein n=1 Tax=Sphingomonas sp. CD22 TaxID=3100214 RepID=UPI002ADFB928|nr:acyltransferase [Sphingomonas sp. CD22]MEA1085878.1 acyltransferase [Sphingomonas sp. CD22]
MSKHVGQFETLRGVAASWVFISHAMAIAELSLWPFNDGGLAVDVFILLSGFVITLLVNRRPEPYSGYIFRRSMRLYPLYLTALALGLLTQGYGPPAFAPVLFGQVASPAWYAVVTGPEVVPNLLLHLTMLHGLVPDTILANASTAFSGPLWSVSLEWQFYLVAPLIIWLLDVRVPRRRIIAAISLVAIFAGQMAAGRLWHGQVPAFLPLRLPIFAIGVLSGHLWERAQTAPLLKVGAVWFAWIAVLAIAGRNFAPFVAWGFTYVTAVAHERSRWANGVNTILLSRHLRWLGERSYGIYVLHLPILLFVAATLIVPFARSLGKPMTFTLLMLVYPLVVVLAAILYRFLERPIIRWARAVEVENLIAIRRSRSK